VSDRLTNETTDPMSLCDIAEDEWTIEPVAVSVAEARRRAVADARRWCPEPLPDDYADTIRRVVSELVTNAIRHAGEGGPISISLCATTKGNLIVEVTDGSPEPPTPRDPYGDGGYGLAVVAAEAIAWYWRPSGKGKAVGATIALPHSRTRSRRTVAAGTERGRPALGRPPTVAVPTRQAVVSAT
jgi:anti-sigma regulatory factor (Ser/Thr protein kinase)